MKHCEKLADAGRRSFFARTAAAAAGVAATATLPAGPAAATPSLARVTYPSMRLGNISELKVNISKIIAYPDAESPGVLIRLGSRVVGGAGPDGDVVAFSTMCPHKGYGLQYRADDKTLNCPGHYSRFDCEKGGLLIWGQSTSNLPQFQLRIDPAGDIYAESVDELLYGRLSNILTA